MKVGYEYSDCDLVWNIQSTKLSGHDMTSSDIDGWNLNVQHKYNYHAGILQKGDGNTVYLKYKPQVSNLKKLVVRISMTLYKYSSLIIKKQLIS